MHSGSILFYLLLHMIHEPQGALLTFLVDQHGTDSVADRGSDARVQYSIGVLRH